MIAPVVVLEDQQHRIDHLRRLVPRQRPVYWAQSVLALEQILRSEISQPCLVILDHDLGPNSATSPDVDGYTGMDAARFASIPPGTRVLVWSWNEVKGPRMQFELIRRGYKASWLPFESSEADALISRRAG